MNTDFLKIVSKSTLLTKEILFLFQMKKKSSNLLKDQNRCIKIYIFLLFFNLILNLTGSEGSSWKDYSPMQQQIILRKCTSKSVRLVYIHSDRSLGLVAERRSEEKKSGGPVEKKIHEFTCKQHVMHEQPVTRGPTITLVRVTLSLHTQTPNFSIIIGSSLSLTGIPCIPATCHPPRASPSIPLHLLTKL